MIRLDYTNYVVVDKQTGTVLSGQDLVAVSLPEALWDASDAEQVEYAETYGESLYLKESDDGYNV